MSIRGAYAGVSSSLRLIPAVNVNLISEDY